MSSRVNHPHETAPDAVPPASRNPLRPTQADIARATGVSQATVSIVLRHADPPTVPPSTQARIRAAAEALGYVPNRLAQGLRNARTMTIACVVPDITNPYYPGFVRGVQRTAAPAGYDVTIIDTDASEAGERRALAWLLQGRADGVVGAFFHLGLADLAPLAQAGIAIARVQSRRQRAGPIPIDNVFIDNQAAAAAATRLLLARGHRAIAVIAGNHGPGNERVLGYTAAMHAACLAPDVLRDPEFTAAGGARCATTLLTRQDRPTAIFGANDMMAIGAIGVLRAAGLAIPGDVAVIGFDDTPTAALLNPALTTVRQDEQAVGAATARLVIDRLAGPAGLPGRSVCLPFQLVERASV